jgi:hypothetical protein
MKIIGSQRRETLKEAGYIMVSRPAKGVVIIRPIGGSNAEIWYANNHHAGYTIQIGRWGYEFGMDCKQMLLTNGKQSA